MTQPTTLAFTLLAVSAGLTLLLSGAGSPTGSGPVGQRAALHVRQAQAPLLGTPQGSPPALPRAALGGHADPSEVAHEPTLSQPQAQGSQVARLQLALPVDPLLQANADAEDLLEWYGLRPTADLIRNHFRFGALKRYLKLHTCKDLDELNLDPQTRGMLKQEAVWRTEFAWLKKRLAEFKQLPRFGVLPARIEDDEQDFRRQYQGMDLEQISVVQHAIDHAFQVERARLVEACFEAGIYTSRVRPKRAWG